MQDNKQNKVIEVTKEGLEELKQEFEELTKVKLPEVVARVAKAREHGDLSENSEYKSARDDKDIIDSRIAEIERILANAKVVKRSKSHKKVGVGSTVVISLEGEKTKHEFKIVGEFESDPEEGRISNVSPIGKALLGKKKGSKVKVKVPAGDKVYEIIEIK